MIVIRKLGEIMNDKKVTGFDYLWLSLYAVAGLCFELLLVFIEQVIGIDINNSTSSQIIIHWCITIIIWVLIGIIIIKLGKKTTNFDIWENTNKKLKVWQVVAIILCFVINIAVKYIDWDGFKVIQEFQSRGILLFIFQYLYYIAEGFLISLIVVYGQKACEIWLKKENIPYGGIILGLTWGLGHILSKGSVKVGLLSAIAGVLFGAVYLFVNRDYKKTFPIITLLFMI